MRYDVTVHDYMATCPRINLIDRSGLYCGEPDLGSCEHCIARVASPFGKPSVWHWRDRYARLFGGARKVFVPDLDVQRRTKRFFPGVEFELRRHPELRSVTPMQCTATARRSSPSVRIALLGALGPHKGSALLERWRRRRGNKDRPSASSSSATPTATTGCVSWASRSPAGIPARKDLADLPWPTRTRFVPRSLPGSARVAADHRGLLRARRGGVKRQRRLRVSAAERAARVAAKPRCTA